MHNDNNKWKKRIWRWNAGFSHVMYIASTRPVPRDGPKPAQHPKEWNLWKKTETGVLDKKR